MSEEGKDRSPKKFQSDKKNTDKANQNNQQVTFAQALLEQQQLDDFTEQMKELTLIKADKQYKSSMKRNQDRTSQEEFRADDVSQEFSNNFAQIDRQISNQKNETMIRGLVHVMVQPIIDLARRNIEHNAKKNEKFAELNARYDFIQKDTSALQRDIMELRRLPKDIQMVDKNMQLTKVETKGRLDAQDLAIKRLQLRQDELENIRTDVIHMFDLRDTKMSAIEDRFSKLQYSQISNINQVINRVEQDMQNFGNIFEKQEKELQQALFKVGELKNICKEVEETHLSIQYNIKLHDNELKELHSSSLANLNNRIDSVLKLTLENNQRMNEVDIASKKCILHSNEMTKQYVSCKDYVTKTLPIITYMQLSDMMQEFLCLPDQLKLIQVDNERLIQLSNHDLSYESLINYTNEVVKQCIVQAKGLGRFKLGESLDQEYLNQRFELLESHGETYWKMQQDQQKNATNQLHMGCLNGTILKEVRLYYNQGRKQKQRKFKRKFCNKQKEEKSECEQSGSEPEDKVEETANSTQQIISAENNSPVKQRVDHYKNDATKSQKADKKRNLQKGQRNDLPQFNRKSNQVIKSHQGNKEGSRKNSEVTKDLVQNEEQKLAQENEQPQKNQGKQMSITNQYSNFDSAKDQDEACNKISQQTHQDQVTQKLIATNQSSTKSTTENMFQKLSSGADKEKYLAQFQANSTSMNAELLKSIQDKQKNHDSQIQLIFHQFALINKTAESQIQTVFKRFETTEEAQKETMLENQRKQEAQLLVIESVRSFATERFNQLENQITQVSQRLYEDFFNHKSLMESEYIEFFKSRKKIRSEWSAYLAKSQEEYNKLVETIQNYESNLIQINTNDQKLANISKLLLNFALAQKYSSFDINLQRKQQHQSKNDASSNLKLPQINQLPSTNNCGDTKEITSDIQQTNEAEVKSMIETEIESLFMHPKLISQKTNLVKDTPIENKPKQMTEKMFGSIQKAILNRIENVNQKLNKQNIGKSQSLERINKVYETEEELSRNLFGQVSNFLNTQCTQIMSDKPRNLSNVSATGSAGKSGKNIQIFQPYTEQSISRPSTTESQKANDRRKTQIFSVQARKSVLTGGFQSLPNLNQANQNLSGKVSIYLNQGIQKLKVKQSEQQMNSSYEQAPIGEMLEKSRSSDSDISTVHQNLSQGHSESVRRIK